MTVYYVVYILMLFSGIWRLLSTRELDKRESRKGYCILFAVMWVGLIGLRHPSMGIDLHYGEVGGYLGQYELISQLTWKEVFLEKVQHYERGYIIFNKLLSCISDDYQFLLFVCAAIPISVIAYWIYRNSDYPMLSTFIYLGLPVFLINFSALRQALTIPFSLVAFELIRRKKFVWFVLLVFLSTLFHSASIVFLIAYPAYWVKLSQRWSKLSITFPFVVFLFRYPLFNVLSKLFKENAVPSDNSAINLFLVFCAVYIFAVLFEDKDDPDELGIRNLYLMGCVCQAFSGVYSTAMRVGYYFMIYAVLLLPRIVRNMDKKALQGHDKQSSMILYIPILVCFFTFGLYMLAQENWAMTNPHSFFWQN